MLETLEKPQFIPEKEPQKTPEKILQDVLPTAWEEALEFAKQKNFATEEEIKKRIELAKKYNIEIEHFFYNPDTLGYTIEVEDQIKPVSNESVLTNNFCQEFSRQTRTPVLAIFNARAGTIYSYGPSSLNTQLNFQFEKLSDKENIPDEQKQKFIDGLRQKFAQDVQKTKEWQSNKKLAILNTAQTWIENNKIDSLVLSINNFRIKSTKASPNADLKYTSFDSVPSQTQKCWENHSTILIDASKASKPGSFSRFEDEYCREIKKFPKLCFLPASQIEQKVTEIIKETQETNQSHDGDPSEKSLICLNSYRKNRRWANDYLWWDNFSWVLGKMGKKFRHRKNVELPEGEQPNLPTEKIIKTAERVEYLSEKIKNTLRYYMRDEKGENWFEREFNGLMIAKGLKPGTEEYLKKFRAWVPYETYEHSGLDNKEKELIEKEFTQAIAFTPGLKHGTKEYEERYKRYLEIYLAFTPHKTYEAGKAKLDNKGYPIPRAEEIAAKAAEDELTRIEEAMQELKEV
ncbi:MAG: hypothetical protein PHE59_04035 [Patescibacteria group bacterium]|nr:hypothetical protein [Patescibacteria group bacterium]MDD5164687.1 hypothetical protein [Patescibacteria group bacterium]MDD5534991.1 hypothetical protein [Patescibacteria group bacterium]